MLDWLSDAWIVLFTVWGFFWPNCTCCGVSCVEQEDNFNRDDDTDLGGDWTERSGDWEIASNKLSIGDANAIAEYSTAGTSGRVQQVKAKIRGTASGDKARLLVNYSNSNDDAWIAEFEFGTPGTIRLINRDNGTDTIVREWDVDIAIDTDHSVRACYHSGSAFLPDGIQWPNHLTVHFGSAVRVSHKGTTSSATSVPGSTRVFGLGTGDTVTGTITFDDFKIERIDISTVSGDFDSGDLASSGDDGCPECAGCFWPQGAPLRDIEVDFGGSNMTSTAACTGTKKCEDIAASVICSADDDGIFAADCKFKFDWPTAICTSASRKLNRTVIRIGAGDAIIGGTDNNRRISVSVNNDLGEREAYWYEDHTVGELCPSDDATVTLGNFNRTVPAGFEMCTNWPTSIDLNPQ